jgi:hypothetical protein
MTDRTREDANQLAQLLNQICTATVEALQADDPQHRLAVSATLRDLLPQVEALPEVAAFVGVLARWLDGERPTGATVQSLEGPYRRVLATMLDDAPEPSPPTTPGEPISRRVLAQLVSAVVIAEVSGDEAVQRKLAAQLVTIQGQLDREWKQRLGPLLENLRAVLGGTDPRALPLPGEPLYQQLWLSARELLLAGEFSGEAAGAQLLDRLVHNALFALKSNNPDLTAALLRALLDVQRQALETDSPTIATLVGAIRARLQGLDPAPFIALLEGEELAAWQRILEGLEQTP